ncbi:NPCBM/NEW2 domain-containing protein [Fuerstiella marisgermanici]|uniref:NPCBM/NEW2 domain protein n=1 Tax=Fuerstiella marisgermanici TaxID=1891926 RepID=A0A1P8WRT5_9PLAN|nr:NPCBM/NEW2 domain-containing protein [Fuerstiella marisgermanici]APZ96771.1 NPCBM/NEW2 domain protein [Fuerstiella marisgermanici]
MSVLTAIKLLIASLALADVRVSTLDEKTITGPLVSIDGTQVVVKSDAENDSSVALADVMEVSFAAVNDEQQPAADVEQLIQLVDGSTVQSDSIEATADAVTATALGEQQLKLPRATVRAVRLQKLDDDWTPQWDAFLQRKNNKDLLIVAKRDGSGLDFLAGVVSSIGAEEVRFLLDGDEIPVPRARVFGIVFAEKDRKESGLSGNVSVKLRNGSVLVARTVSLDNDQLTAESSWGQMLKLPVNGVEAIDFSSGRIHFLSDLEPLSEQYFGLDPPGREWGPLFQADSDTRTGLSRQWKMSRDAFPNSGRPPITLRGKKYRKGVCIFPSAKVEYALDGRYSSLQAVVGVDDEVAFNQLPGKPPTVVELRVESDGEEVYKKLVTAPEDPVELKLNLKGVTTLAIIVDFGDGSSTCDYLDIANARLFVDTSAE